MSKPFKVLHTIALFQELKTMMERISKILLTKFLRLYKTKNIRKNMPKCLEVRLKNTPIKLTYYIAP